MAEEPTPLHEVPLFKGLSEQELSSLEPLLHPRTFPAGVEIMLEEQPGEVAYVVLTGSMKIHVEQPDGSTVILAILGPGEVVGEMSLVDSLGRSASVATIEECRVLWIDREAFWGCLRTMPWLTYNLVGVLSRRIRLANAHIEALSALDVRGRVATQLLGLVAEYGEGEGERQIGIPLTQGDLGALTGASRVRVNQVLGEFRRRGLVSIDEQSRISVLDAEGLRKRTR